MSPGPEPCPSWQVLQSSLQKELAMGKGQASAMEMLRCPALRHLFLCLSMLWSARTDRPTDSCRGESTCPGWEESDEREETSAGLQ